MLGQMGVPLTFTPTVDRGDMTQYVAQSPADIATGTFSPNGQSYENQSIFIRGYKISACKTLQERVRRGPVKISDVLSQKNEDSTSCDAIPGTTFLGRILSKLTNFNRRASKDQPTESLDNNILQVESFPGPPEVRDSSPQSSQC
jgi:hypothetical protein